MKWATLSDIDWAKVQSWSQLHHTASPLQKRFILVGILFVCRQHYIQKWGEREHEKPCVDTICLGGLKLHA